MIVERRGESGYTLFVWLAIRSMHGYPIVDNSASSPIVFHNPTYPNSANPSGLCPTPPAFPSIPYQ
jgi:hypothetical protein